VDVGAAVVTDEQPFELVQPGEGALDDPAVATEARAVLMLAASDERCDPALAELTAVDRLVVAAVGDQLLRPSPRSPGDTSDRRHRVDQWDQLGAVVAIASGECERERCPFPIDEEVVLGAASSSVHRARARFGAPFFACT
jgi:hypothetical protein